jgi:hypothetical protein
LLLHTLQTKTLRYNLPKASGKVFLTIPTFNLFKQSLNINFAT